VFREGTLRVDEIPQRQFKHEQALGLLSTVHGGGGFVIIHCRPRLLARTHPGGFFGHGWPRNPANRAGLVAKLGLHLRSAGFIVGWWWLVCQVIDGVGVGCCWVVVQQMLVGLGLWL